MARNTEFILWFKDLKIEDIPLVGGKNASLGEMYRELTKKGIRIPNGFATTAHAYKYLLKHSGIEKEMRKLLEGLDVKNVKQLAEIGRKIRELIRRAEFPEDLKEAIFKAYKQLSKQYGTSEVDVAVRSSATAEDLPEASFAGQQETYLNIVGEHALLDACRNCFASLFTNRAIAYRAEKGFDHFKVYLSIGIQKMVRSDLASSGVMFTLDTETGFPHVCFITSSWGLGENVVQGAVNPDEFYVFKPTLKEGYKPIIQKVLGEKSIKMIYATEGTHPTKNIATPPEERRKFSLTDEEVLQLAKWGVIIEDHYSQKKGKWTPMDIEWAKDGQSGKLFVVQARPETVQSQKSKTILEEYVLKQKGKVILTGKSVGNKIGSGTAQVIKDVKEIDRFKPGDILVTEMTDPDWVPIMRMAKAIVTNKGGRTCHAAIVSRELGIPCVVGTLHATEKIKNGQKITVSCAEGEEGKVYDGILKYDIQKIDLKQMPKTKTKVMMNVGNPEEAFELSFIPNQGVGLARMEFVINEYIKIHPMALIKFDKLMDETAKRKIEELTHGYKNKPDFFVDKLAQGLGMITAAFYPNDVIVRLSDFKTNEYANLIGGAEFEPKEENPMIGWRGASRYYREGYSPAFALECKAIKKVRDEFGLTNLKVMVPFCRTVEEGKHVVAEMAKNGLKQGKNGLQVYVMCEIPSNVVLADEFSKVFDGFSIGSNDLTQLTLGLDRDSAIVSELFDERNEAVKRMVEYAIRTVKANHRKIGICGDAPSTYPDFAQFLVQCGIDSISLSPDAVVKTTLKIAEMEKKLKK
ncbi:MAG: phosphoenolpyruvate synthase [Candidatus Woesearchaeota archaeon]